MVRSRKHVSQYSCNMEFLHAGVLRVANPAAVWLNTAAAQIISSNQKWVHHQDIPPKNGLLTRWYVDARMFFTQLSRLQVSDTIQNCGCGSYR